MSPGIPWLRLNRIFAVLGLAMTLCVAGVNSASAAPGAGKDGAAAPAKSIALVKMDKGAVKAPTGTVSEGLGACDVAGTSAQLVFTCYVLTPSTLLVDCFYFYLGANLPVGVYTLRGSCLPGFYYTHFVY